MPSSSLQIDEWRSEMKHKQENHPIINFFFLCFTRPVHGMNHVLEQFHFDLSSGEHELSLKPRQDVQFQLWLSFRADDELFFTLLMSGLMWMSAESDKVDGWKVFGVVDIIKNPSTLL